MIRLALETLIQAQQERCFDLARDMNTHAETMAKSGERIVASPPSGILEMGDEVTFEAVHFGIRQQLTARITAYDRPNTFTDQMLRGAFKSLIHEHRFDQVGTQTRMTDLVSMEAPFGPLGWLAERLFLRGYMTRLLRQRGLSLKAIAENEAS